MLKVMRYKGLSSLPLSYTNLFEEASQESFFLSFPWFKNFEERIVKPDEKVLIYGVEESELNGQPVMALVLLLRPFRKCGKFFITFQLESLSNYYSCYFGPLTSKALEDKQEAIDVLAKAIFEDRKTWHVLNLKPLDPSSTEFQWLLKAFKKLGMAAQTYFCFGNWYLDVAGKKYQEYFQGLPKVLKKKYSL